jgi:uncharacterized membrane protein
MNFPWPLVLMFPMILVISISASTLDKTFKELDSENRNKIKNAGLKLWPIIIIYMALLILVPVLWYCLRHEFIPFIYLSIQAILSVIPIVSAHYKTLQKIKAPLSFQKAWLKFQISNIVSYSIFWTFISLKK